MSYWYGFIAQFTILPFHQEFADSGTGLVPCFQHHPFEYAKLAGAALLHSSRRIIAELKADKV